MSPTSFSFLSLVLFLALSLASHCVAGEGLYWSVDKPGTATSYLVGTVHSDDQRVLKRARLLLKYLTGSRTFAMELIPDQSAVTEIALAMRIPTGEPDLEAVLGPDRFKRVVALLQPYGMPDFLVRGLRPWAAFLTLSYPRPESGLFMDMLFYQEAQRAGIAVLGLESVAEQLSYFENLSRSEQITLIDLVLDDPQANDSSLDAMIRRYLENDLSALAQLSGEQFERMPKALGEAMKKSLLIDRNQRMVSRLTEKLAPGGLFVAVGALHLQGTHGLIDQLRDAGFVLKPIAIGQ